MNRIKTSKTTTTRTTAFWGQPRRPMITHAIDPFWMPSQNKTKSQVKTRQSQSYIFKWLAKTSIFLNFATTLWSCLVGCVYMKWIRRVLGKIQSVHDFVHRRTDDKEETSIPPSISLSGGYNNQLVRLHVVKCTQMIPAKTLDRWYVWKYWSSHTVSNMTVNSKAIWFFIIL